MIGLHLVDSRRYRGDCWRCLVREWMSCQLQTWTFSGCLEHRSSISKAHSPAPFHCKKTNVKVTRLVVHQIHHQQKQFFGFLILINMIDSNISSYRLEESEEAPFFVTIPSEIPDVNTVLAWAYFIKRSISLLLIDLLIGPHQHTHTAQVSYSTRGACKFHITRTDGTHKIYPTYEVFFILFYQLTWFQDRI